MEHSPEDGPAKIKRHNFVKSLILANFKDFNVEASISVPTIKYMP